MKKTLSIILAVIIVMFCVVSCAESIVSEIPIDADCFDCIEIYCNFKDFLKY